MHCIFQCENLYFRYCMYLHLHWTSFGLKVVKIYTITHPIIRCTLYPPLNEKRGQHTTLKEGFWKNKIKRIWTHKGLVQILRLSLPLKWFDPGYVLGTMYVMCSLDLRVVNKRGSAVSAQAFDTSWRQLPLLGEVLII